MINRRATAITITLGIGFLTACQSRVMTPTDVEATRISSETYLAYERGDCETVLSLSDPNRLDDWAYNEMRHSMLLLQGFCREIGGDVEGARDIYRQLVLEAPGSFASDDAAERTRILSLMENDPDYDRLTRTARERIDAQTARRTPIDRVPVEFPPLARAVGIDGYAVLEFGISRRGDTISPIVVDSSPPLLFDGASLRAVRRWQYTRTSLDDDDDRQLIRILFRGGGTKY